VSFDFRAIGTPTTSGQLYPCNASNNWLSNLLLCHEGLTSTLQNNCNVQLSTGIKEQRNLSYEVSMPEEINNYSLLIKNSSSVKQIYITSLPGTKIMVKNNFGGEKMEMDCSTFKNGIYFLTIVSSDNQIVSRKFSLVR
jgi:hypothetical protein